MGLLGPLVRAAGLFLAITITNSFPSEPDEREPTTLDELLDVNLNSNTTEFEKKTNPLDHVKEKHIARSWGTFHGKQAHIYCKRACKKGLAISCADFPEQCTTDFKHTLLEDCTAECRYEFDSTFSFKTYVRPKPHKNGKKDNDKKNGNKQNGKDKNKKHPTTAAPKKAPTKAPSKATTKATTKAPTKAPSEAQTKPAAEATTVAEAQATTTVAEAQATTTVAEAQATTTAAEATT